MFLFFFDKQDAHIESNKGTAIKLVSDYLKIHYKSILYKDNELIKHDGMCIPPQPLYMAIRNIDLFKDTYMGVKIEKDAIAGFKVTFDGDMTFPFSNGFVAEDLARNPDIDNLNFQKKEDR